jgi:hypothetical protein
MSANLPNADAPEQAARFAECSYEIRVYLRGAAGFFTYKLVGLERAMEHFRAITDKGYRRVDEQGRLVHYMPSILEQVQVIGDGLSTHYPDTFQRT